MTTKPNILMIVADQLTCAAIGSYQGKYSCTPHIDALANQGVRFNCAYTLTPLCQPARAAMWTGMFPHQTGVLSNGSSNTPHCEKPIDPVLPTLGKLFNNAGWRTVHFGKTHDKGALAGFKITDPKGSVELPPTPGYPMNHDSFGDAFSSQKACEFLESYPTNKGSNDNSPFMAVVDLVNPHNICQWTGDNKNVINETLSPEDDARLPQLPDNFMTDDFAHRPLPVRYLCCTHRRQAQTTHWSNATFRRYIDAYQHYTHMVDTQIGRILATLAKRPDADNTYILFTADHGDALTSHRIATKHTAFYDNITRVPFILSGPGLPAQASSNTLASLIDVLPTLCNLADIDTPDTCAGNSLVPLAQNPTQAGSRNYVISQWYTEWGNTISPGRMVRSKRYKYTHYLEGQGEELFDMHHDPGETKTLHNDPAHATVLAAHRAMLKEHIAKTNDPYFTYHVFVPTEFRAHPSGYEHHP